MRPLLPLALLLTALSAQAQDDKLWQLDLIAFERATSSRHGGFEETWSFRRIDWPEALALDADFIRPEPQDTPPLHVTELAAERGVRILPLAQSRLAEAGRRLESSTRYRILSRHSLRFSQKTRTPRLQLRGGEKLRLIARDTRQETGSGVDYWLSEPDLEPPVSTRSFFGWARLDHQIHPILKLDIRLLELLPGVYPLQTDPDGRQEYFRDQVQQYRLQQERRLRPGLTAYFDHPRIGVLARLTEIEPKPPVEAPDPAASEDTAAAD